MAATTGADEIIVRGFRDVPPPETVVFATCTSALKGVRNTVMAGVRCFVLVGRLNVPFCI